MTVEVEPNDPAEADRDLAGCIVTTTDATGTERRYRISLTPDELTDGHIMAGRRVDDGAPDEDAGGGVSASAWDAARDHFRERGYEVHG